MTSLSLRINIITLLSHSASLLHQETHSGIMAPMLILGSTRLSSIPTRLIISLTAIELPTHQYILIMKMLLNIVECYLLDYSEIIFQVVFFCSQLIDILYTTLCSGLTEKALLSFISSNSSFTECVRTKLSFITISSISSLPNEPCTGPDYEDCSFSSPHITLSSSASFSSCTFSSLTSSLNGGAIYSVSSGTLSISLSIFEKCSANVGTGDFLGGGAVCVDAGYFVSDFNTFISCSTSYFGGGILAQRQFISSNILSCNFICCSGCYGGGINTFFGPYTTTISSHFISCTVSKGGGGFYHDSNVDCSSLTVSDCLFTCNCAEYVNGSTTEQTRGGGAFEDFRASTYTSKYSFSLFTGNTAPSGVGNDISVVWIALTETPIDYCFTTTTSHSLWNTKYTGYENWLSQSNNYNKFTLQECGTKSL